MSLNPNESITYCKLEKKQMAKNKAALCSPEGRPQSELNWNYASLKHLVISDMKPKTFWKLAKMTSTMICSQKPVFPTYQWSNTARTPFQELSFCSDKPTYASVCPRRCSNPHKARKCAPSEGQPLLLWHVKLDCLSLKGFQGECFHSNP